MNCLIWSLSPANVRQEARVFSRLCAQVFCLGHVKQDVHDVGGDVQGQGQPPVRFAYVVEYLPPKLRPSHEAVVCGSSSPFLPARIGGGGGGEVLRGLQEGRPVVRRGINGHVALAPEADCHVVIAKEREAVVGEVQTQAGGRCAQDREQQQGVQGRQHAVSSARNIQSNINFCILSRWFIWKLRGKLLNTVLPHRFQL